MEEEAANDQTMNEEEMENVSIPTGPSIRPIGKEKGKGKKNVWIFGSVLLLIVVVAILWFIFQEPGDIASSPSPAVGGISTSTPASTPTPEPVDRSEVSILVLNGTGIGGEAGFLQGKLKELGYESVEVGNADDQDNTVTLVTFSTSLSSTAVEEITKELKDIYQDVETKTSSSLDTDVEIVTGLRVGQTAKPSPTASPEPSPTATPEETTSPEPSPGA